MPPASSLADWRGEIKWEISGKRNGMFLLDYLGLNSKVNIILTSVAMMDNICDAAHIGYQSYCASECDCPGIVRCDYHGFARPRF